MAPRPSWKGHLKLSLVTCPVAMVNAVTHRQKVSFHLVNRATGHRLRRQMIDPETGDVVDAEDQVHGYEVGKNDFLVVEDEEIDRLRLESTHPIEVDQFVARADVDDVLLDTPYYLLPDGPLGADAFAVIREAMARRKMAGVARIVLSRREHVLLIEPHGRGMVATTLRYPAEITPAADVFDAVGDPAIPDDMLDLAGHIIDTKTKAFDPATFADRYENALLGLIRAKKAGKPVKPGTTSPEPDNVIDLMDALRRSVGAAPDRVAKGAKTGTRSKPKPATKGARRRKAG